MIVALPEIKTHLRLDPNVHDEDLLLESFAAAAETQVTGWIGRPIYATPEALPGIADPAYDAAQIVAGPAVKVSILMLVERMYQHRGGEGDGNADAAPPLTVRAMLAPLCMFARVPQRDTAWPDADW